MELDRLYRDPDLAQFYDIENAWYEGDESCVALAAGRSSILDLGCGTGLLAATLAQEEQRLVVGVDPARSMLDLAARRPGGERVRWVAGDARTVRLDRRFDLVVMTGHAFQVFLTAEDQSAVLSTIACHLAPQGRFVFDTRNPAVEEWREWTPQESERTIEHPVLGKVLAWNNVLHDAGTAIVTYETHYRVLSDGRTYLSSSKIAFPSQEQLSGMLHEAGLVAEKWLGDWAGTPCGPMTRDIIPLGTPR